MGRKPKPTLECAMPVDFQRKCEEYGGELVRQSGSHQVWKVRGPLATIVLIIAFHSRQIPTGTACAMRKALIAAGINVFVVGMAIEIARLYLRL